MVGNIKFTADQWKRLMEYVWDCRAVEILQGVKESVIKEIIETTWDRETRRHRRYDADRIGVNFKTELGRLIRQIIEVVPSDGQKEAIRFSTRLFYPTHKNDSQYVNGKMESHDIPGMNVQLVAIGLHAGIRNGNLARNYNCNLALTVRCTRIKEIHVLAYKGIAGLPAGLTMEQDDCAPLPISAGFAQLCPGEQERRILEPVLVRKNAI